MKFEVCIGKWELYLGPRRIKNIPLPENSMKVETSLDKIKKTLETAMLDGIRSGFLIGLGYTLNQLRELLKVLLGLG
jgi:hypothetical protein